MTTRLPAPVFQIRIIGPVRCAHALLEHLVEQTIPLFGPFVTCRTQVRSARRAGHVRAYITVTSKEVAP
jgi:hypothetical protein